MTLPSCCSEWPLQWYEVVEFTVVLQEQIRLWAEQGYRASCQLLARFLSYWKTGLLPIYPCCRATFFPQKSGLSSQSLRFIKNCWENAGLSRQSPFLLMTFRLAWIRQLNWDLKCIIAKREQRQYPSYAGLAAKKKAHIDSWLTANKRSGKLRTIHKPKSWHRD